VEHIGQSTVQLVLAAAAVYAALVAVNRIMKAAAAVAATLLITGYLANPQDPTALLRSTWEAARGPLEQLASVLAAVWRILWRYALSTAGR